MTEGVLHRDLKPQNIMLDKSGRAYVMDFRNRALDAGLGHDANRRADRHARLHVTRAGEGHRQLDARSDLFSLGIIFYEMLSGQVPFDADTTMGKLWKRTNEPARPLDELDKTIPKELSDIVRKCLEIDPQKRFASATELLQQIELWQGPDAGTRILTSKATALPAYAKWAAAVTGSRHDCRCSLAAYKNYCAPRCSSRAGVPAHSGFRQQDGGPGV